MTESYSKAAEQLASDKMVVRLGGIYSLERIARERREDYWPIMETLTAFVREQSCKPSHGAAGGGNTGMQKNLPQKTSPPSWM